MVKKIKAICVKFNVLQSAISWSLHSGMKYLALKFRLMYIDSFWCMNQLELLKVSPCTVWPYLIQPLDQEQEACEISMNVDVAVSTRSIDIKY